LLRLQREGILIFLKVKEVRAIRGNAGLSLDEINKARCPPFFERIGARPCDERWLLSGPLPR
jgi:hypothetical protein